MPKLTEYRSRKEQIETDFMRRLAKQLQEAGCPLNPVGRRLVKTELKWAAMVGACEERDRSLKLIRERGMMADSEITKQSVLAVLGYE